MKLKKVAQVMLIGYSIVSIAACSNMKLGKRASVTDANGVQTQGYGDNGGFGDSAGGDALSKRVYYFDFDRSEIRNADKPAIFANADNLAAHPNGKVLLEGHTDPRGSREYNVALGERRAESVAALMRSRGVNPNQIRVISYGAERLAVPGHSEDAYQQDRRVVLVYLQR